MAKFAKRDPMAAYGVTGYRHIPGLEDTGVFYAWITRDGKPIIEALNNGLGGANIYRGDRAALDALHQAAKLWFAHYRYPVVQEAEDLWLEWHIEERPSGVTAREYVANIRGMVEAYARKGYPTA